MTQGFMSVSQRSASPKRHARAVLDDALERARRLLRVDEEERRRVSLALHTSVTQSLAALAANLDLIEQQSPTLGTAARELLLTSRLLVRDCFRQVRSLTDQLAPPLVAELGLRVAVQCIVAAYSERSGITVTCDAGDCPRLADDVELTILRVVEDCLENLEPIVARASIVLVSPKTTTVELHVHPVRPAVAARWKHRVLLQFERGIDVRMVPLSPTERAPSSARRFGLIVSATSGAA
jgi:signal transduction histidine kinase